MRDCGSDGGRQTARKGALGVPGTGGNTSVGLQAHRLTRANNRADIAINDSSSEGYLYRPGEMLVATADVRLVAAEVDRWKPTRRDRLSALGITRFTFPPDVHVPTLVARLRAGT